MDSEAMHDLFEKHNDEFLKFERIHKKDRLHPRPDICAMMLIHERYPETEDIVSSAEHDQIWFSPQKFGKFTEEDVIYISRCGIMWDKDNECLSSFV